jgi:hypothetical protein
MLAKHKVAGSTPVARSRKPRKPYRLRGFFFLGYGVARRGCGWVADGCRVVQHMNLAAAARLRGNREFQEDPHWRDLILFYE